MRIHSFKPTRPNFRAFKSLDRHFWTTLHLVNGFVEPKIVKIFGWDMVYVREAHFSETTVHFGKYQAAEKYCTMHAASIKRSWAFLKIFLPFIDHVDCCYFHGLAVSSSTHSIFPFNIVYYFFEGVIMITKNNWVSRFLNQNHICRVQF